MNLTDQIIDRIHKIVVTLYGQAPEGLKIGFPPDISLGDVTIECFPLAKQFRNSPAKIAGNIVDHLEPDDVILEASAKGPYINVKINAASLFKYVCRTLFECPPFIIPPQAPPGDQVMVEYLSPNTNKPLHLGHLRNGALGMAVANLHEAIGHRVIKANLVNDRGVHICKSMLAWQHWGEGQTPESEGLKGDAFVGKWYVRFSKEAENNSSLENDAQSMLQRWEKGDPDTLRIWKMMNKWVYEGFSETYEKMGLRFDTFYYESETYKYGKDIIEDGLNRNIFSKDDRKNTLFLLPEDDFGLDEKGLPKKVTVLRPDGTSLYITQDIGTTVMKVIDQQLDKCIFVVGSEQNFHFQCLFTILKALGYDWAENCHHLSYGMVYLPEGKMKSREGKVVDADDLLDQMALLAAEEIRQRNPEGQLTQDEIVKRAAKIGVGAVKFYLLRVKPTQDIHFDPQESISFDGFTGPYCQYAHARICGIIRKAEAMGLGTEQSTLQSLGNDEERALAQQLIRFSETVRRAALEFNPSIVASYLFNTAKLFNQFYNKHSVIHADTDTQKRDRLALTRSTASVLKKGLELLNIDALERM
jgi:arginyl-tRNA synthetase